MRISDWGSDVCSSDPAAAIDRIANDRCVKARRGMHPDLVRPAGKRAELDQRPPPALFDRSPAGLRGLSLWIGDHPPTLGARRALVERQVDQPAPALRHARTEEPTSDLQSLKPHTIIAFSFIKKQAITNHTIPPTISHYTH